MMPTEEVERCQQQKWESLQTYLPRLKAEVTHLAQVCCMNTAEVLAGADFTDNESVVGHLETRLEDLRDVYARHSVAYDSISAYDRLWAALFEVEVKMKDPAILANRGGILLKTEKEKKRLLKELQRVEQETQETIRKYQSAGDADQFRLSSGLTFGEYAAKRWEDYRVSREPTRSRGKVIGANGGGSSSRSSSLHPESPQHPGAPR
ncbi:unnamed protein product [Protopolystoma xenopodis]|uniref:Uncharacterized protein n=1 Tax=Protopolystoma xenopodis TaxID=117903 RepID=A0A3S4ZJ43_9PLAT|nr:unnamed protein product [Protopolystoma xenopodis]